MAGIVRLETPVTVHTLDWAFKHLGCNALVVRDSDINNMMILAYAESKEYNRDLYEIKKTIDNSEIFTNVDEDEMDSIDDCTLRIWRCSK